MTTGTPAVSQSERALLRSVIGAISAGPGAETTAAAIADLVKQVTATDVCFVYVLDDTGRSLTLAGATPPFHREVGSVRLTLGDGIVGWVARHQQPVVLAEGKRRDTRHRAVSGLRDDDFVSLASVPVANAQTGLVGVLDVHTRQRREFTATEVALLTRVSRMVAGGLHIARRHRCILRGERAHGQVADRAVAAQEAERDRLVRELHDGISQRLVSLAYHLDAAQRTVMSNPSLASGQLREARELAVLALDETRSAIANLRPPVLDDLGLAGALRTVVRGLTDVDVYLDVCDTRLPDDIEAALYRIAQEAVQNATKHAAATSVKLSYTYGRGVARLEVSDDGLGFDTAVQSEGHGLTGMTERASMADGRLRVRSCPGAGTTITVVVPTPAQGETELPHGTTPRREDRTGDAT